MTRLYRARLARRQAVTAVAGLVRAAGNVGTPRHGADTLARRVAR